MLAHTCTHAAPQTFLQPLFTVKLPQGTVSSYCPNPSPPIGPLAPPSPKLLLSGAPGATRTTSADYLSSSPQPTLRSLRWWKSRPLLGPWTPPPPAELPPISLHFLCQWMCPSFSPGLFSPSVGHTQCRADKSKLRVLVEQLADNNYKSWTKY